MTDLDPGNNQGRTPAPPAPTPAKRRRDPLIAILMTIGGVILLLPGACSLFFMFAIGTGGDGGALAWLWLICFAISAGGLAMIVKAFR